MTPSTTLVATVFTVVVAGAGSVVVGATVVVATGSVVVADGSVVVGATVVVAAMVVVGSCVHCAYSVTLEANEYVAPSIYGVPLPF